MTDLTGGLAPDKDLVFPARPDDPEMRESVSVWLFEENGAFGFPRGGIEAEAASWDERRVQANFAFADGRVLNGAGVGAAHSPFDADGKPAVLGAGPLAFRCVKPFRRWTMVYDGEVRDGTVDQQIHGGFGARTTSVRLEADMVMATPAWVQDTADTSSMSEAEAANAAAMGLGYRFEHLFRATGTLTVDGTTREFRGTGLRIHRQSVRRLEGFSGHCWQSALFPDGSAFHSLVYPPLPGSDEPFSHNDAAIYQDGRLYPAKVVRAPFLRRIVGSGDDVTVELESELGRTVIEGETALSTFRVGNPDIGGLNLQQSGVRYRWGDHTAYGMIERSSHESLTTIG